MPDDQVVDFLKEHRLGVLATGRRDGSPQQALIAYDFDGNDAVITTRAPSAKAHNLSRQPRASLCVTDGPRFVVIYGHADVITDEAEVATLNRERLSWMWEQMGGGADEDEL